ncbi:class I mannose-6-phosphate isomerase [Planctomicrobium sp.]|jgi:mannose-6-phosphate isomerase|nr:class I mannose-6-phosphate isomerase [Planctomicrobium sp.]MDB4439913.1 class I mannose-6-phosphate isomerase [Planctomicrobium sp.]
MDVLRFEPIFKQALWGGSRLKTELSKATGDVQTVAESWEVADLQNDQSIVVEGPHAGTSVRELLRTHKNELLGKHADRDCFPLLVKFLDANRDLSVQVHPGVEMARRVPDVTTGKAEFWVVLEAEPGSKISVGLKENVDRQAMIDAIADGTVPELLHTYEVSAGDCIFLEPGTVHSLGAGILVAEIQEPNNTTYRLDDWGRLGPDGNPRELHTELALEAINFDLGPIHPLDLPTAKAGYSRLLLENQFFAVQEHRGEASLEIPHDQRAHVLTMISGSAELNSNSCNHIQKGETIVIPAQHEPLTLQLGEQAVVLDSWLM